MPLLCRLSMRIKGFGLRFKVASSALGNDALISGNRAHREPVVAVVVVRVRVTGIEVQVVGVERVRRVLRGRPVVAAQAGIVEVGDEAVARCWQEDAVTVYLARELTTFDTI